MITALIGSTATGKSDIALKIAKQTGASILSCDSLLVYKDMNIGTAKPLASELEDVPHFGIDLISLNENFTAGDYVRYANTVIEDHKKQGKPLLIVGGTGFYLKALLFGIWQVPPTNPEIRERLEPLDNETLHKKLQSLDEKYSKKVEPNDRYRVIRALEVIEQTGKPLSEQVELQKETIKPLFEMNIFGIKRIPTDLQRRIVERTNQMFSKGLVDEVKALSKNFENNYPKALLSVGYKEVLDMLAGKTTIAETRELVTIHTRQLAKKQTTFFKTFPQKIDWYEIPSKQAELETVLEQSLK